MAGFLEALQQAGGAGEQGESKLGGAQRPPMMEKPEKPEGCTCPACGAQLKVVAAEPALPTEEPKTAMAAPVMGR